MKKLIAVINALSIMIFGGTAVNAEDIPVMEREQQELVVTAEDGVSLNLCYTKMDSGEFELTDYYFIDPEYPGSRYSSDADDPFFDPYPDDPSYQPYVLPGEDVFADYSDTGRYEAVIYEGHIEGGETDSVRSVSYTKYYVIDKQERTVHYLGCTVLNSEIPLNAEEDRSGLYTKGTDTADGEAENPSTGNHEASAAAAAVTAALSAVVIADSRRKR